MRGILRVIPSEASLKSHRTLILRRIPSERLLDDLVGGPFNLINEFDTILDEGRPLPCLALRTRESEDQSPNVFASWLWLQSQLRRNNGFSGLTPATQGALRGTIVLLYGDDEFFDELIATLAFPELPRLTPLPSQDESVYTPPT